MAVTSTRAWLIVTLTVVSLGLMLTLLLLYLLFTGRGGEPSPPSTPNPLLTPAAVDLSLSTAARIRQRGKVRIGVRNDLRPFGFVDAEGRLAGFDVALAHELARRWLNDEAAV